MTTTSRPSPAPAAAPPDLALATCIEAGVLEEMVLRLFESVRRFAGRFASCPLYAVQPRSGLPLRRVTLRALEQLQVTFLAPRPRDPYDWYHFLNKPHTLFAAAGHARNRLIAFLDADVLLTAPPEDFDLPSDVGFTALPERGSIESTGPEHPNDPWWSAICRATGVDLQALPMVTPPGAATPIRFYFQGGVIVMERSGNAVELYLKFTRDILDARIVAGPSGIHWAEQCSIGLAVVKANCRWRALDASHNQIVHHWGNKGGLPDAATLARARVIHYHNAMDEPAWPKLPEALQRDHRPVADWLLARGPVRSPTPRWLLPLAKLHRWRHARRRAAHLRSCH